MSSRGKRGKSIIVFLLTLRLIILMSKPVFAYFPDISGHWAQKLIINGVDNRIVKGYNDGTFRPNNGITRAEFTAMLNSAFDLKDTTLIGFTDVVPSDWYYDNVAKAKAAGYILGYSDVTFRPDKLISR